MHDEETPFSSLFLWLDSVYNQAIKGGLGADSAAQLAGRYLDAFPVVHQAANSLVIWESSKAATSGFIMGLGGVVSLPVTLPAGLTGLLFIQFRMIAAVAILGGFSPDDIRARHLVYVCLGGYAVKELLHSAGMNFIGQISVRTLRDVSEKTVATFITRIATGFSTGSTVRLVPLVGGIINGGMDWLQVRSAGALACEVFLNNPSIIN